MKTKFPALLLCLVSVCLAAATEIKLLPDGRFQVGELTPAITHWGENWQNVRAQNSKCVTGKIDGLRFEGEFLVHGGSFRLDEEFTRNSDDSADCLYRVTGNSLIPTQQLALVVNIPRNAFTSPLLVDGKPAVFGETFDSKRWQLRYPKAKRFELPLASGSYIFEGDLSLWVLDGRMFQGDVISLRFEFTPPPASGKLEKAELRFRLTHHPVAASPLDLRPAMNMGFADRVAGDGKGGWTDQGPDNDMSSLPIGKLVYRGIPFNIIDPAANGGNSCIVLKSRQMPMMPVRTEIRFDRPARGKYLYLLHALAWASKSGAEIGEVACSLDSSEAVEKQTLLFPLTANRDVADFWMPKSLSHGEVAWRGANASASIGLYLTRIDLTGEPLNRLAFTTRANSNWLIVGATLSDQRLDPAETRPVEITAGEDWLPIRNAARIQPGSLLDFSRLTLDPPAGKHGRVVRRGEHLEFETKPGTPFRFYGANIVFWSHYLDRQSADKLADDLAAIGYNILRFHMFDFPQAILYENDDIRLRPEFQDKLDYLVSALKKRGIYITLDIFGIRHIAKGELPDFPDREINAKDFKGILFLSEPAQRNFESFTRNLFNHVNPYTGLAWKDEPAIATVSLVNEGTIFATAARNAFLSGLFTARFETWAKEQNLQLTPANRNVEYQRFLSLLYHRYYDRLSRFLRDEIGLKAPLTDQNYSNSVALTLLRDRYDLVDNHFYWAHPVFPGKYNTPPWVIMNDSSIGRYAGGLSGAFISRIFGKPFTVTEWDYVVPNSHAVEGAFLTGAYAALQDWSGLCRFAYSTDPQFIRTPDMPLGFFQIANDPLRLLSERAGLLFFLRGDVRPAEAAYPYLVRRNHLDHPAAAENFPSLPARLGLIGRTGAAIVDQPSAFTPPAGSVFLSGNEAAWEAKNPFPLPLVTPAVPREDLVELNRRKLLPPAAWEPETDTFRSDTGELRLEREANRFRAVTPRSEGFVLPAGQSLDGNLVRVDNKRAFAALLVAAMDGRPLADSERMLVLHLTDTKNSGIKYSGPEMNTCTDAGGLPLLVRNGEAEIVLKRDLTGYRFHALGFDGGRLAEIAFTVREGKSHLPCRTRLGEQAVAAYELVKQP